MSLNTYTALQAAIADWLERSDLAGRIPDFIRLAEVQIARTLNERRTLRRATALITDAFSACPDDLVQARTISMSEGDEVWLLSPAPPDLVERQAAQNSKGRPRYWTVVGDEFRYYPAPDRGYVATLAYEFRPPTLSEASPTNWLLQQHPDLYLFGALKEAGPYLRDAAAAMLFETKFRTALDEVRMARRAPVGALRVETPLSATGFNIVEG